MREVMLAVGLAGLAGAALAQDVTGSIVAGGDEGTDTAMARDIAGIAAECGIDLGVQGSEGSVENMTAVRDRPRTQFGIVQSDVLDYFQAFEADDPVLARTARGVRIAFPLNDSAVHVLARTEVADLAALDGRRVAIGPEGSGTRVTANLVMDLAGVTPAERVALAPEDAVQALLAGDVDAMVYVGGVPAAVFDDPRLADGVHLLPLEAPSLTAAYAPAEIGTGTYRFVSSAVPVVKVRSLLVTFDYVPRRNGYQAASCQLVADVGHLLLTRLGRLQAEGHPAWKTVDPTDLPAGWQVSDCVLQGLDAAYPFVCRRPDGSEVSEGAAGGEGASALFISRVCARIGC
jgi:TRAP transporter TAXI family solute receptor